MVFLQWLISILLPALSGLVGVFVGAGLTSRRERREQKLRSYGEVFKVLVEAYEATRTLHIAASNVSMTELAKEELARATEVQLRVHQAVGVALITAGEETGAALAAFEIEWRDAATGGKTTAEIARLRMEASDKAQGALLTAARRELTT